MIALVKDQMKTIHDVCQKHHVQSLYLIGSAVEESAFTAESDIDFVYRFRKDEIAEMEYADNYFSFLFAMQDLFNRKVDLVPEEKIRNPYFMENINRTKQKIYEA